MDKPKNKYIMKQIILIEYDDLKQLLQEIFVENINKVKEITREIPPKENLLSEEALIFLKEQGYPITKTTLNKMCSLGEIPYKRQGKRRVFSRSQLLAWLSQGCPNKQLKTNPMEALTRNINEHEDSDIILNEIKRIYPDCKNVYYDRIKKQMYCDDIPIEIYVENNEIKIKAS